MGAPVLTTWCASCHSAGLEGLARRGAPHDINVDTLDAVRNLAGPIRAASIGASATMPPAGPIPSEDQARLAMWLDCGLPGAGPRPAEPSACETTEQWAGDYHTGDDPSLCPQATVVEGDLVVEGDADLSCLCGVEGSVRGVNAAVSRLVAPELRKIGGDLWLEDNPELQRVELPRVLEIGGALTVRNLPVLEVWETWRLDSVGGHLLVADNPRLTSLDATASIETVGGGVELLNNAGLAIMGGLTRLREVGGPVVIRDHASLQDLRGFVFITSLDVPLVIEGNPELRRITGFADLEHLAGPLVIRDNPRLESGPDLPYLVTTGDITVEGTSHPQLPVWQDLAEVNGTLVLRNLPELRSLARAPSLRWVREDLVFSNNPRVAEGERDLWLDAIEVEGMLAVD